MLINSSSLHGYKVHATDGEIGHIREIYFDDLNWVVRYLVVDAGNWLTGRTILISNFSIGGADHEARTLLVKLTRDQVEDAPEAGTHPPVTRQWEGAFFDYYSLPYYWGAYGGYGVAGLPVDVASAAVLLPPPRVSEPPEPNPEDSHLQSATDVSGYAIHARDGEIGHLSDFIVDDTNWTIRYIEVDTRHWWVGKRVLVAPAWIAHLGWPEGQVEVNLTREAIRSAPEYDHHRPISAQYEIDLLDYYGQHLKNLAPNH